MKRSSSTFVRWQDVILVIVVAVAVVLKPAYGRTNPPVLLLQQSPAEGGTLTPSEGIHHFDLNASVTLTAVPRPGYQFVCWLGDVGDPMANTTTVYLDAPKIVVAVFERVAYELPVVEGGAQSAPIGGLLGSAPDYYGPQGFGGPGGKRPHKFRAAAPPEEPEPEELDEFPVPVPEPSTVVLLLVGGLFVCGRRGKRKQVL